MHECEKAMYFEACLPIEEMARRGVDTLRFGPMKPVGLIDPRPAKIPYAAVQLRQENLQADSYNLVGFQNHLRFGEQETSISSDPGLGTSKIPRDSDRFIATPSSTPRVCCNLRCSAPKQKRFFCWTDFWCRRLCGVHCHGFTGWNQCREADMLAKSCSSRPATPPSVR